MKIVWRTVTKDRFIDELVEFCRDKEIGDSIPFNDYHTVQLVEIFGSRCIAMGSQGGWIKAVDININYLDTVIDDLTTLVNEFCTDQCYSDCVRIGDRVRCWKDLKGVELINFLCVYDNYIRENIDRMKKDPSFIPDSLENFFDGEYESAEE